ncbi:RNA polymerase, sigma-24 subunit, ECF subfamily [Methylobacterium sp. 4-46]|uniref:RNA polymerase sigma factor n=1 Tax=unclassified Methylobacterium TaxID=2615210 RepID=UPI000152E25C|nr:sigma-70 family RNA polymerase sigma factor [Methylobacterium sp. 4-46]ACA15869.1 RNA polymerase, sigma-24 subunit, ECF subfamily [Methylobacterium sp. 4-46]
MSRTASPLPEETRLAAAMAAAQGGDARAYRTLLRDCVPVIAAVARAQGVPASAVDDIVQETLLTLHRARATYDPARPFLPWLRALAQRRSVDHLRRSARRVAEVHAPLALEGAADPAPLALDRLAGRERHSRLARAIEALPGAQRLAVEQLVVRERSLAEAAAGTGRSKGSLKVNLHRALRTLRAMLSGDGEGDGEREGAGSGTLPAQRRSVAIDRRPGASASWAVGAPSRRGNDMPVPAALRPALAAPARAPSDRRSRR